MFVLNKKKSSGGKAMNTTIEGVLLFAAFGLLRGVHYFLNRNSVPKALES